MTDRFYWYVMGEVLIKYRHSIIVLLIYIVYILNIHNNTFSIVMYSAVFVVYEYCQWPELLFIISIISKYLITYKSHKLIVMKARPMSDAGLSSLLLNIYTVSLSKEIPEQTSMAKKNVFILYHWKQLSIYW